MAEETVYPVEQQDEKVQTPAPAVVPAAAPAANFGRIEPTESINPREE